MNPLVAGGMARMPQLAGQMRLSPMAIAQWLLSAGQGGMGAEGGPQMQGPDPYGGMDAARRAMFDQVSNAGLLGNGQAPIGPTPKAPEVAQPLGDGTTDPRLATMPQTGPMPPQRPAMFGGNVPMPPQRPADLPAPGAAPAGMPANPPMPPRRPQMAAPAPAAAPAPQQQPPGLLGNQDGADPAFMAWLRKSLQAGSPDAAIALQDMRDRGMSYPF
jgi:hypothetical protein